ncbi:MAG TPA: hypothetical protein DEG32_06425 [Balneolaceae bacterium]|nr:hypothetical protein [Balneolaceae bacterium]
MCISNNEYNRKDFNPDLSLSKIPPTHKTGIRTYEDGYKWAVLYKIDLPLQKFVTSRFIPVPDSVRDFNKNSTSSGLNSLASQLCGSSAGNTGACCIYTNERKYDAGTQTYVNVNALDFCICETSCWKCNEVAGRLDTEFIFNKGETCGSCLSKVSPLSGADKILGENPNPLSNDFIQSNNVKQYGGGKILIAKIDLSGLSEQERVVRNPNPVVSVDGDGNSFQATLITEFNEDYGNVVVGIKNERAGNGYTNVDVVYIDGKTSIFSNRIHFTFDENQGLLSDVRSILGASTLEYYLNVRDADISSKISQTKFTTYGIIKNMLDNDGNKFGADKNVSQKHFESCLTKMTVEKIDSSEIESVEHPSIGQKLVTANTQKGELVSFKESTDKKSATIEFSSKQHKKIPTTGNIDLTSIDGKTTTYKINSVVESPINTNTGKKILKNVFSYNVPETVVNNGKTLTIRVFQPF